MRYGGALFGHSATPVSRWIGYWQCGLNLLLLGGAVVLWALGVRRALFLLVLVPVAFVPFSYARLQLCLFLEQLLATRPTTARLFVLFVWTSVLLDGVMAAQLLTARSDEAIPMLRAPGIAWVGAIWYSAHGLLFLGYLVLGVGRLSGRLLRWICRVQRPEAPTSLPSPERRQFLQQMGLVGAGVPFFISLSNVKLSYDFRVEERHLVVPHWPRELDGLRIAHLSDIHVGGGMDRARLLRMAALTNAARPDIVLHTGDFLTHRSGDFDAPLYEALARIHAPYGQWACLGNHDFDDPHRLVHRLREAGVVTLRDALATVSIDDHDLEIAGLDYLFSFSRREEHYAAITRAWGPREGVPRILLNHDPRTFAILPHGCADLVLCGHTHGGHVGVQWGRDRALTVVGLCGIPDQGIFSRPQMVMFVTRCVGFYGYPMRLGIPPEIALLIVRAPQRLGPGRTDG
ncbi:MAG: metallophosphoesterase [Candidatus Binatia bacterium]|nr:metallophosphoesterase [Candidatus Binatia bacterium]